MVVCEIVAPLGVGIWGVGVLDGVGLIHPIPPDPSHAAEGWMKHVHAAPLVGAGLGDRLVLNGVCARDGHLLDVEEFNLQHPVLGRSCGHVDRLGGAQGEFGFAAPVAAQIPLVLLSDVLHRLRVRVHRCADLVQLVHLLGAETRHHLRHVGTVGRGLVHPRIYPLGVQLVFVVVETLVVLGGDPVGRLRAANHVLARALLDACGLLGCARRSIWISNKLGSAHRHSGVLRQLGRAQRGRQLVLATHQLRCALIDQLVGRTFVQLLHGDSGIDLCTGGLLRQALRHALHRHCGHHTNGPGQHQPPHPAHEWVMRHRAVFGVFKYSHSASIRG